MFQSPWIISKHFRFLEMNFNVLYVLKISKEREMLIFTWKSTQGRGHIHAEMLAVHKHLKPAVIEWDMKGPVQYTKDIP